MSEIFTNLFHGLVIISVKRLIRNDNIFWHVLCIQCSAVCLGKRAVCPKRGRVLPMGSEDGPLGLITILGTPALIGATIFLVHLLPSGVLTILTAWILASFPIGVLIGHCVLSED